MGRLIRQRTTFDGSREAFRAMTARKARPRRSSFAYLVALALWPMLIAPLQAAETQWRRGINMGDYLAYPTGAEWPIFRGPRTRTSDDEFQRLAAAGFDFIRLSVEPGPFLDRTADQVAVLEGRLLDFVDRAGRAGLKVMVTGWARHEAAHWSPTRILAAADGPQFNAYAQFLTRLAELLGRYPASSWALQLMNEPQPACKRGDGPDWLHLQQTLYARMRAVAPKATLVVTGTCWSKLEGLELLDLSGFDRDTLVDVHYYDPWIFTHQSATWSHAWVQHVAGLSFPPSRTDAKAAIAASRRLYRFRQTGGPAALAEAGRNIERYVASGFGEDDIRSAMAQIARWGAAQKLPRNRIVIGEFGVYRVPREAGIAEDGSRERWIAAVRRAAEAEGLGWAFFAYHSGFGLVTDDERASFHRPTLDALGLRATGTGSGN